MTQGGFIALHRRIRESYIWQMPPGQRCVAIEIFLGANWKPGTWYAQGQVIEIGRGELVTSLAKLAEAAGVSKACVRRAISALIAGDTIGTKSAQRWTHITIRNYDYYNPLDGEERHEVGTTVAPNRTREQETKKKEIVEQSPTPCPSGQVPINGIGHVEPAAKANGVPRGKELTEVCAEVLGLLNQRAGRDFKPTTEEYRRLIKARLAQGYTKDDLALVVIGQAAKWAGDEKMAEYLRPDTLFAKSNCRKYHDAAREAYRRECGHAWEERHAGS